MLDHLVRLGPFLPYMSDYFTNMLQTQFSLMQGAWSNNNYNGDDDVAQHVLGAVEMLYTCESSRSLQQSHDVDSIIRPIYT